MSPTIPSEFEQTASSDYNQSFSYSGNDSECILTISTEDNLGYYSDIDDYIENRLYINDEYDKDSVLINGNNWTKISYGAGVKYKYHILLKGDIFYQTHLKIFSNSDVNACTKFYDQITSSLKVD